MELMAILVTALHGRLRLNLSSSFSYFRLRFAAPGVRWW
jgi:hypothetical protein